MTSSSPSGSTGATSQLSAGHIATPSAAEEAVRAKVVEDLCNNPGVSSVAIHSPTNAIVVSENKEYRGNWHPSVRVGRFTPDGKVFDSELVIEIHNFTNICGSCVSINQTNVAALFYGAPRNSKRAVAGQVAQISVWSLGERKRVIYDLAPAPYNKISLAGDTWLVAARTPRTNPGDQVYKIVLLHLENRNRNKKIFQLVLQGHEKHPGRFCYLDSNESTSSGVTITALIKVDACGTLTFKISVPLSKLVGFAESDREVVAWKEWEPFATIQLVGDCRCRFVPGCGHVPPSDNQDYVVPCS